MAFAKRDHDQVKAAGCPYKIHPDLQSLRGPSNSGFGLFVDISSFCFSVRASSESRQGTALQGSGGEVGLWLVWYGCYALARWQSSLGSMLVCFSESPSSVTKSLGCDVPPLVIRTSVLEKGEQWAPTLAYHVLLKAAKGKPGAQKCWTMLVFDS